MKQALPVHAKAAGRVSDIGRSVAAAEMTTYPIHASMCWKTRELLPGRAARVSRRKTAKVASRGHLSTRFSSQDGWHALTDGQGASSLKSVGRRSGRAPEVCTGSTFLGLAAGS